MSKMSTFESQNAAAARRVAVLSRRWGRALRNLFHPYHPERHYMRGPGPKWHAKHAFGHSHG